MKTLLALIFLFTALQAQAESETVTFPSGKLTLHGVLYKPSGNGPFPAVLYNHGSAPGTLNDEVAEALGPHYANRGWVFFMPHRRGQGLSESAGPYIMDQVRAAGKKGGTSSAASTLTHLLTTDHLADELAALTWLKKSKLVDPRKIAVAGNSFGGILTVLGAEKGSYCAAVDAAGAAMSWADAPEIQKLLIQSVRMSQVPIFFFQADNDYDLAPSKVLSAAMRGAGRASEMKIYPAFGKSEKDGHSFAYKGAAIWGEDVFAFLAKHCAVIPVPR